MGRTVAGITGFLLLYVIAVLVLSRITVNGAEAANGQRDIAVYILTNGVHTDIVVPVKNEVRDWTKEVPFRQTRSKDSIMNYLAFGWGDKGFYLDTPEWSDLKAGTAFNAVFNLGSSAMHTTFYKKMTEGEDCKKIMLSKEDYRQLVAYIAGSFQRDANEKALWIQHRSYGKNDAFYEANGAYNLFYTCNTWANNALKAARLKASWWTVYDKGIFCHYN